MPGRANIGTRYRVKERSGVAHTAGDDKLTGETAEGIAILRASRDTVA
jgi:hypothetical protein